MYNAAVQHRSVAIAERPTRLMAPEETARTDWSAFTDEALLGLITQREEAALGALYDRYAALVYTIALRITGDRQTAEEVMQDVFQSVWQTAGGFQQTLGAVSGWIVGIARHRAIDATRTKRERARTREVTGIDQTTLPFAAPAADAGIEHYALSEAVRTALADLPQNQRQAIELAYYGGLTRVEIAERLGEPLGTVKTRLRLGLSKLRDLLRPFAE